MGQGMRAGDRMGWRGGKGGALGVIMAKWVVRRRGMTLLVRTLLVRGAGE